MEGHIRRRKNRWMRRKQTDGTYYHLMNNANANDGNEEDDAHDYSSDNGSDNSSQFSALCENQESDLDIFDSNDEFDEMDSNNVQGQDLDDGYMKELLSSASYVSSTRLEGSLNSSTKRHKRTGHVSSAKEKELVLKQYIESKQNLAEATKEYLEKVQIDEAVRKDPKFQLVKIPEKRIQYDCESILSSYTNTENRPSVILPATLTTAHATCTTHFPRADPPCARSDFAALKDVPHKHPLESKDEKKERRKLVKALQAERRKVKKEVSSMYKQEHIRKLNSKAKTGSGVKQFTLS